MKLARPDIFHPRIVLAGDRPASDEPAGRVDDIELIDALRHRGLRASSLGWDDPETLRADLVVLRATHDYRDRRDEFLDWTRRVRNLLNAPDVIAWNSDPRYLRDLQYAGVPTAPPAGAGDPAGQTALVFFGGGQSHAFGAAGTDPDFELWDLGRAALRAAAEQLSVRIDEFLYARADVIGTPANAALTGLDLIAPQLGWRALGATERAESQRLFVLCVEAALERLDLGPLSHRRP